MRTLEQSSTQSSGQDVCRSSVFASTVAPAPILLFSHRGADADVSDSVSVTGVCGAGLVMSTPSSTFESLIAIASDDAQLRATLSKHLYPALDALPAAHAQKLTKALRDAEEEFRYMKTLLNKVDYDGRKRLFEADLKAARDSRDINVWRTTEEKWLGAIGDWLSTLWQLGVEKGHERQLVWRCLMFCEEVMRRTVPPPDITVEWSVITPAFSISVLF